MDFSKIAIHNTITKYEADGSNSYYIPEKQPLEIIIPNKINPTITDKLMLKKKKNFSASEI